MYLKVKCASVKREACRVQAGNSKSGRAQVPCPKAGMGKIGCGCFGVPQQEHIAVSGRIWVASGALQI